MCCVETTQNSEISFKMQKRGRTQKGDRDSPDRSTVRKERRTRVFIFMGFFIKVPEAGKRKKIKKWEKGREREDSSVGKGLGMKV